jgi:hypothetical protein
MNLPMLSFMFCHIEQYSHHFGLLYKKIFSSISSLPWIPWNLRREVNENNIIIDCLVHDRMTSGYAVFKYTKTLNYECHWHVAQDRNEFWSFDHINLFEFKGFNAMWLRLSHWICDLFCVKESQYLH